MGSEYSIHIEFDKSLTERPERVFEAMALLVQGFNEVQSELIKGYGESLKFEAALANVREGSLIADVNRKVIESVRSLNLRTLLDSIYFSLEDTITHTGKIDSEGDIDRLIETVYGDDTVQNESYRSFTSPPKANNYKIAKGIKKVCDGVNKLAETDKVEVGVANNFKEISKDLSFPRSVEEIFREEKKSYPSKDVLIIRRPDYVGSSKWDFISLKRGERPVSARITHKEWLEDWRNHEIQVLPGDALHVMIQTTKIVGRNKQLERYEYVVTEIIDVVPQSQVKQSKLEFES